MKLSFRLNQLISVCCVGAMLLPVVVNAEVFKWKDKDGTIRYSDTPPPSNIKQEPISGKKVTKPTGKAPLSPASEVAKPAETAAAPIRNGATESVTSEEAAAKLRQRNAETEKKNKAEKEAQAKIKAEHCKAAKANKEAYTQGGRVYKMNEKGEREYMDDKDLKDGINKSQKEMNENCS